jgi:hypothetical protein
MGGLIRIRAQTNHRLFMMDLTMPRLRHVLRFHGPAWSYNTLGIEIKSESDCGFDVFSELRGAVENS